VTIPRSRQATIMLGAAFVAVALAATVLAAARAADADAGGGGPRVLGPGPATVELRIEHSRFVPDVIRVREGTTLTFRVRNGDPIGHELIVGGPDVHARHESGTEAAHAPVPGEVSIAPLAVATTTFTFEPGGSSTVVFACHLPGHVAYGMRGEIRVEPAAPV
jgi:uncharacterized cupredoxin-like copper-binding protein